MEPTKKEKLSELANRFLCKMSLYIIPLGSLTRAHIPRNSPCGAWKIFDYASGDLYQNLTDNSLKPVRDHFFDAVRSSPAPKTWEEFLGLLQTCINTSTRMPAHLLQPRHVFMDNRKKFSNLVENFIEDFKKIDPVYWGIFDLYLRERKSQKFLADLLREKGPETAP